MKDGGQAFPIAMRSNNHMGMTLRQWYKGMILSGIAGRTVPTSINVDINEIVDVTGIIADAMIAEDEAHELKKAPKA